MAEARWELLKHTSKVRAATRWLGLWVSSKVKAVVSEIGASTANKISFLEGREVTFRVVFDNNRVPDRISRYIFIKVIHASLYPIRLLVLVC
jgi:hypothetical protein